MAQKIRLNRINFDSVTKVALKYRKARWYYKVFAGLAIAGLPALALLDVSPHYAGLFFAGMSSVLLILHMVVSYTKYVTLLIPNILHIMIMPFSFGLYWGSGIGNSMTSSQFLSIYTQGSLFGSIYTILVIPIVFKVTRGRPWLTFSIIYFFVDFFALFTTQYVPQLGLLNPVIVTAIILALRSKLLHKLVFKSKYRTTSNSFLEQNSKTIGFFTNRLNESFSDNTEVKKLDESEFFDYTITTPNRVFVVYALQLPHKLTLSFHDTGTKLSYLGTAQDQEIGIISQEAVKFSKRWGIPAKDITPIVLGDRVLAKKYGFIGVNVKQKEASLKGHFSEVGMVYFLDITKLDTLETAWKNHTITHKSKPKKKRGKTDIDDSNNSDNPLPKEEGHDNGAS